MDKADDRKLIDPGEKGVIDHVAEELVDPDAASVVHSPTTDTGKPVEDQVKKEWDPKKKGGLPTFLRGAGN